MKVSPSLKGHDLLAEPLKNKSFLCPGDIMFKFYLLTVDDALLGSKSKLLFVETFRVVQIQLRKLNDLFSIYDLFEHLGTSHREFQIYLPLLDLIKPDHGQPRSTHDPSRCLSISLHPHS